MAYSAASVDDIVDQVTNNPAVAKRYASHFGIPSAQLAEYFKQNLKPMTVRTPVKVQTYFIDKNGRILSKQRWLKPGRLVFVGPGGNIILEADCGNPVTKKLPVVKSKVMGTTETVESLPDVDELLPPPILASPDTMDVVETALTRVPLTEPVAALASTPSILQIAEVVVPAMAGLNYVQNKKDSETVVPEPSSVAALAMAFCGTGAFVLRRRRG